MERPGTPSRAASNSISAALAAPSSGGAASRTSSAPPRVPAISLLRARGMTRTAMSTPVFVPRITRLRKGLTASALGLARGVARRPSWFSGAVAVPLPQAQAHGRPAPHRPPAARARASACGATPPLRDIAGCRCWRTRRLRQRRAASSLLLVLDVEPGALVDEELDDRHGAAAVDRAVQRRLAVLVDVVDVAAADLVAPASRRPAPPRACRGSRPAPRRRRRPPPSGRTCRRSLVSFGSAPCSSSARISGTSADLAAIRNGVAPMRFSMLRLPSRGSFVMRAFTSAPRATSFCTELEAVEAAGRHGARQVEAAVRPPRPGDLVQRRPSLVGGVRVGAAVEQERRPARSARC